MRYHLTRLGRRGPGVRSLQVDESAESTCLFVCQHWHVGPVLFHHFPLVSTNNFSTLASKVVGVRRAFSDSLFGEVQDSA
jgi:hypothetical protein